MSEREYTRSKDAGEKGESGPMPGALRSVRPPKVARQSVKFIIWAEKQAMHNFGERLKAELALRKLIEEKNQRKRVTRCGGKRHSH